MAILQIIKNKKMFVSNRDSINYMYSEGYPIDIITEEMNMGIHGVETALFGVEEKPQQKYVYKDEEPEAITGALLSPDHEILCDLVGQLFSGIKRSFNVGHNKVINRRSYEKYDSVLESITRVLYESDDFIFENEVQAKTFILGRVARYMNTEGIRTKRAPVMVRWDGDVEWWLGLLDYVNNPVGDIADMMEVLKDISDVKTVAMINDKRLGYSHEEISKRQNTSKSTVSRRLEKAFQLLKSI